MSELCCEKAKDVFGFPTMSDLNRAEQPDDVGSRGIVIIIYDDNVVKTKALISCAVTVQLIWVFVFPYAKNRFSHDIGPNLISDNR